ncbi:hypothetical protein E2C01_041344 [Portunus trituberculatus]|uniref:Ig-like domain-containing protein n=1 Tax=Portunus trituberculatus TaxID=210409 RepID=A0A5B7FRH2_PORTR|nr:hypothetical protein [Portunus trituberculatus]
MALSRRSDCHLFQIHVLGTKQHVRETRGCPTSARGIRRHLGTHDKTCGKIQIRTNQTNFLTEETWWPERRTFAATGSMPQVAWTPEAGRGEVIKEVVVPTGTISVNIQIGSRFSLALIRSSPIIASTRPGLPRNLVRSQFQARTLTQVNTKHSLTFRLINATSGPELFTCTSFRYHNGEVVHYSGKKDMAVQTAEGTSRLGVVDVGPEHSGNYTCVPENAAPATVTVYVLRGRERKGTAVKRGEWTVMKTGE